MSKMIFLPWHLIITGVIYCSLLQLLISANIPKIKENKLSKVIQNWPTWCTRGDWDQDLDCGGALPSSAKDPGVVAGV